MKNSTFSFNSFCSLVLLLYGISNVEGQPVMGKSPKFLEGVKPNFYKMQKKAEKYFKKHPVQLRVEEDSIEEQEIGFEEGYDREEDNEYIRYKRWEWYWRDRVNPDGSFPDAHANYETYQNLQSQHNYRLEETNPTWTDVSMKRNTGGYWGLGRTESVAINPKNSLEFYTTSDGGGVWKTTDGGKTYIPVGDQLPMLFCGKIIIDHQNTNTIYVSLGDDHNTGGNYGLGVYKSIDGGATWKPTGLTAARNSTISIRFMAMNPIDSKVLIAVTNRGVYRTTNGGDTWTVVQQGSYFDVAFKPNSGNVIYASSYNNGGRSEIFKSLDGGVTWTQVSSFNTPSARIRLTTSLSNPNFLGVALMGGNQYYTSTNEGVTYTLRSTMPSGCELLVSQVNTNNVYCGCVDNYKSTDGGATWAQFTHWSGGNGLKEVHADNHGINYDPSKPYEIYVSNDGGVEKYNEQSNTWTYLSNGLAITMYYQIGVAQTNPVVMAGGTQDNGGNMRRRDGTWRNTTGGDATSCLIDPSDDNIQYSQYINGTGIARTNNAWGSRVSLDNAITAAGGTGGDWATPFAIHEANPAIIVAGYRDVLLSTNRGDVWKKISTSLSTSAIRKIAISPSDAKHIYAANGSNFYRTFDQATWATITHPGGGINKIVVHPTNPKTVYTTNNGGNGRRVFKSTDGGTTWTNMTLTGIPDNISVVGLAYDKASNEGLYIGTTVGVFYKDGTMNSWTYFGTGLPNTSITDLQISYAAKKIRVGTYGRGIWEANLYSTIVANLDNEASSNSIIKIYPNPFQEKITIETASSISNVKVYDLKGVEIVNKTNYDGKVLELKSLESGIYNLEITTKDGKSWTEKIIKE